MSVSVFVCVFVRVCACACVLCVRVRVCCVFACARVCRAGLHTIVPIPMRNDAVGGLALLHSGSGLYGPSYEGALGGKGEAYTPASGIAVTASDDGNLHAWSLF